MLHLNIICDKMLEKNRLRLHELITEISKLSAEIDVLKQKREALLEVFKEIQSNDDKLDLTVEVN